MSIGEMRLQLSHQRILDVLDAVAAFTDRVLVTLTSDLVASGSRPEPHRQQGTGHGESLESAVHRRAGKAGPLQLQPFGDLISGAVGAEIADRLPDEPPRLGLALPFREGNLPHLNNLPAPIGSQVIYPGAELTRTEASPPPARSARARIESAARARFAAGGRPSVTEIVAAAGVSRATFHRLFGTRERLLAELELEPDRLTADAVLDEAGRLLARDGLARLSMDELAERAGISRASLYRLHPGKAALFRAMVRRFSPLASIAGVMDRMAGQPPAEVMPELAVAAWRVVSANFGVVRPLLMEASSLSPEVRETLLEEVLPGLMNSVGAYVLGQMAAGTLRPMHPLAALQSFAGPIMLHVILQPLLSEGVGIEMDSEAVVRQFGSNWVRGMTPG